MLILGSFSLGQYALFVLLFLMPYFVSVVFFLLVPLSPANILQDIPVNVAAVFKSLPSSDKVERVTQASKEFHGYSFGICPF